VIIIESNEEMSKIANISMGIVGLFSGFLLIIGILTALISITRGDGVSARGEIYTWEIYSLLVFGIILIYQSKTIKEPLTDTILFFLSIGSFAKLFADSIIFFILGLYFY